MLASPGDLPRSSLDVDFHFLCLDVVTTGECRSSSSLYGGPPSLKVIAGNCSRTLEGAVFSENHGGVADHCLSSHEGN